MICTRSIWLSAVFTGRPTWKENRTRERPKRGLKFLCTEDVGSCGAASKYLQNKHEVAGCTDHCTGRTSLRLKFYVAWPALLGLSNSTAPCLHHKLIDSRAVPCMPRLPTLLPKERRTDDLWTSCWPAAEKKTTYHVFCRFLNGDTDQFSLSESARFLTLC